MQHFFQGVIKRLSSLAILSCFFITTFAMANNDNSNEKAKAQNTAKLTDVQKAIARQESNIFNTNKAREKLEHQLKQDDLAIAQAAKLVNNTTQSINTTKQKITKLNIEKQQLNSQKKQQEVLLAKQLRSAYTTGQHDYLKLLLNQDKSEQIQRTITYYQYLNKARTKEIDAYKHTIATLLTISAEHQKQIEQLQVLQTSQQKQQIKLNHNKQQRKKTIAALNKKLLSSKQQLAKLKAEEGNLTATLQKLEALIRAEMDLVGLSKLKRKLAWPVKGRLMRSFGSKKQGYLRWKGVLLGAPIGRQVSTIHNGTILFSDWLKGYGLLIVIDHGGGYMSLYAHNQTLLKSVGDRVETGEPIALVGQSGGQDQAGLYFEIRHQGKAVNPKHWCK